LLSVLRLEHCIDLVTVGPDLAKCSLIDVDADQEELVARAMEGRSDLRDAINQVELARTNLNNKGITPFLPTPFMSYSNGHLKGSPDDQPKHGGGRSDFSASVQWQFKALGFGNKAEYERTWYQWEIACMQQIKLAEQIDREVRQALIAARAARRLGELRKAALPTAREALQLSETRLRSGEGLAIDVLQGQDVLTRAESDYVNAVIDFDRAQLILWSRLGALMPVDNSKPLRKKTVFELPTYSGVPENADASPLDLGSTSSLILDTAGETINTTAPH
jgi:outer membrane protein TolC